MELHVEEFEREDEQKWDRFVRNDAVNGTIFHTRNFLNYHPEDRFNDCSSMIYDEDKLIGVVPCNKEDSGYFSHSGSSYGGPVVRKRYYKVKRLMKILDKIMDFYNGELGMRLAPSIFSEVHNDPIVYYYGRERSVTRELAVYKDISVDNLLESIPRQSNRRAIRRNRKSEFEVHTPRTEQDVEKFYQILNENLQKHNASPTHNLDEFRDLRNRLENNQLLLLLFNKEEIIAGAWVIKANARVWHCFYSAKDYEKGDFATFPFLFFHCMQEAKKHGAQYFNFGISTEDSGRKMNVGLFDFKESFGGKTINRYIIE